MGSNRYYLHLIRARVSMKCIPQNNALTQRVCKSATNCILDFISRLLWKSEGACCLCLCIHPFLLLFCVFMRFFQLNVVRCIRIEAANWEHPSSWQQGLAVRCFGYGILLRLGTVISKQLYICNEFRSNTLATLICTVRVSCAIAHLQ